MVIGMISDGILRKIWFEWEFHNLMSIMKINVNKLQDMIEEI